MILLSWDGGEFSFDVATSIDIEGSATIAKRKVETGVDTADHKRHSNRTIRISGVVTNTPIVGGESRAVDNDRDVKIIAQQFDDERDYIAEAAATLEALRASSVLVSVESPTITVDVAELISLTVARSEATDSALFTIALEELTFADTSFAAAPPAPSEPRASRSQQATAQATEDQNADRRSVALRVFEGVFGG